MVCKQKKIWCPFQNIILYFVLIIKRLIGLPIGMTILRMLHLQERAIVGLYRTDYNQGLYNKNRSAIEYFKKSLFLDDDLFYFKYNDYPYHLERGIGHFVLWINPRISLHVNQARMIIETYIATRIRNCKSYVYFKNNYEAKSIKDIDHIHVFVEY